jgi:hypothetical protein
VLGVAQVGDLVEEILEPVGLEYDADEVGAVRFVVAHELPAQEHPGPGQSRAQHVEDADLAVERGLRGCEVRAVLGQLGGDLCLL